MLCLATAGQALSELIEGSDALPIQVRVAGLPPEAACRVRVSAVSPLGSERDLLCFFEGTGEFFWKLESTWVRSLRVQLPWRDLEALAELAVQIGAEQYRFSRADVVAAWLPISRPETEWLSPPGSLVTLESPAPRTSSSLSPRRHALNWPAPAGIAGVLARLGECVPWPLALSTAFLVTLLVVRRLLAHPRWSGPALAALGEGPNPTDDRPASLAGGHGWSAAGLAILIVVLVRLHASDPYWFTQDDNRVENLPNFVHAGRSLANGQFPTWSPYEFLGFPLIDPGRYPFTYPPTFLSYGIARWVLGDECQTLGVWAWGHLLLGFAASVLFARTLGLSPPLAVAAALSFVLSGFTAILGRAWPPATALTLWLPLTMLPLELLRRQAPDWRWLALAAAAIGFSYHTAHVQLWLYTMVPAAAAATILWLSPRLPRDRVLWVVPALLLGLAIAAPVLALQFSWAGRLFRSGGVSWGLLPHLARVFLPPGLAEWVQPNTTGYLGGGKGLLLYSGTFFATSGLAAIALLVGAASLTGDWRRRLERNVWAVLAVLVLLVSFGRDGFLWTPLSCLPGFSKLNQPVKLAAHVTFFLVMAGGVALERLLSRTAARRAVERTLFAAVVALLAWHSGPSTPSFVKWDLPLPFPPLPGLVATRDSPGLLDASCRYLPITESWDGSGEHLWSLSFSLPAYYGLLSAEGYEPLIWASPENARVTRRFLADPLGAARAYGVRWCLQRRSYRPPVVLRDLADSTDMTTSRFDSPALLGAVQGAGRLVGRFAAVQVWELPEACPLAFVSGHPEAALPIDFRGDGADVDTTSLRTGGRVVVNVLARPGMFASGDGSPLALSADEWDRIEVQVPPGTTRLALRCRPDWAYSVTLALGLAAAGLGLAWSVSRIRSLRAW